MSRLEQVFEKGKAFIPFITAGDPNLSITERLIYMLAEAGADLIELGIPFSDPIAEGPVIQAADVRALEAGTTTDLIFDMVEGVRQTCQVPIAFMTYINPVFTYGTKRFMERCRRAGVDAVIVPDVPYEEREELLPYCKEYGITLISMIAPTSRERIDMIANEAEGFLYCVSSLGVTGTRKDLGSDAEEMIRQVKQVRDIPCAVGFGIQAPEQAARVAEYAEGIIVGSAIVKIIGEYGEGCLPKVEEYVRSMKAAIKEK